MIRTRCLLFLLPLALPLAAAAQGFEGRVTAEMGGREVVIQTKGAKSRMDMNMQGMDVYMIVDGDSGTMLSVMPAQKMYMRMDMRAAAEQMGGMGHTPAAPPKITRTGKHETIAGKDCEHVLMESEKGTVDICAAKGMGYFTTPGSGGPMGRGRSGPGIPAGYDALMKEFKDGFFPLRVESVEGDKRTLVLLVKTIAPSPLDASLFVPPADFQEMKMPMGMPGMGRP